MSDTDSWFGALPEHWRMMRAKQLFSRMQRPVREEDDVVTAFRDGQVTLRKNRRVDGFTNSEKEIGYQGVRKGDLVVHAMDAFAVAIGIAEADGKSTPVYSVCTPTGSNVHTPYFARLLRHMALSGYVESLGRGVRERSTEFRWADLSEVALPVPPLQEQERIANFLDDKTARIDALIAEKERLLVLLAEQRLSVAEQVMAPNSEGSKAKLGFTVDLLPGFAFPSDMYSSDEEDIPLLRGVNVSPAAVRWEDAVYWPRNLDSDNLSRFLLEQGDIVFGMDRPWISTGARVAMIDSASAGALLLQRVCRLRGFSRMSQRFIFYAISSDEFRQSIEVDLTGVSVPHISPEQILRFKVPVLSYEEQEARCDKADEEILRIANLEEQTLSMLGALREYRSSLIAAAVTGQLEIANQRGTT